MDKLSENGRSLGSLLKILFNVFLYLPISRFNSRMHAAPLIQHIFHALNNNYYSVSVINNSEQ